MKVMSRGEGAMAGAGRRPAQEEQVAKPGVGGVVAGKDPATLMSVCREAVGMT